MGHRIRFLDGLRGIAILWVFLFHAYARWPQMPYGLHFADLPLIKEGWLGVYLFFLISGYVILMTLERCTTAWSFLHRRWLRLFPGMLICSVLIYASSPWMPERPAGQPGLLQLVPGLTFVSPEWWSKILGRPTPALEGAFWSIFVEFKFYVFAAVFYFRWGHVGLFVAMVFAWALGAWAELAPWHQGPAWGGWAQSLAVHLSFKYFGWFVAGAAFYMCKRSGRSAWRAAGVLVSLLAAVQVTWHVDGPVTAIAAGLCLCFALVNEVGALQAPLEVRWVQLLGVVSYPLYLLHENLLVASTVQWSAHWGAGSAAFPLLVLVILSALAHVIAVQVEPWLKQRLMFGQT